MAATYPRGVPNVWMVPRTMGPMSPPQDLRPPARNDRPERPERPAGPRLPGTGGAGPDQSWRWVLGILFVLVVLALVLSPFFGTKETDELSYTEFIAAANEGRVESARIENTTGRV